MFWYTVIKFPSDRGSPQITGHREMTVSKWTRVKNFVGEWGFPVLGMTILVGCVSGIVVSTILDRKNVKDLERLVDKVGW